MPIGQFRCIALKHAPSVPGASPHGLSAGIGKRWPKLLRSPVRAVIHHMRALSSSGIRML